MQIPTRPLMNGFPATYNGVFIRYRFYLPKACQCFEVLCPSDLPAHRTGSDAAARTEANNVHIRLLIQQEENFSLSMNHKPLRHANLLPPIVLPARS